MLIFQLKRGVLLTGHNPWGLKNRGWIAKAFGFTFKWEHPESTVWMESSLSFGRRILWRKRFMPVEPKSATGVLAAGCLIEIRKDLEETLKERESEGVFPNPKAPWVRWFNGGSMIRKNSPHLVYRWNLTRDWTKFFKNEE